MLSNRPVTEFFFLHFKRVLTLNLMNIEKTMKAVLRMKKIFMRVL